MGELAALYHGAWMALSGSRNSSGFSAGMIPYTAITAWGRDRGIDDPDDLERLVWGVQAVDVTFLEHMNAKTKTDTTAKRDHS